MDAARCLLPDSLCLWIAQQTVSGRLPTAGQCHTECVDAAWHLTLNRLNDVHGAGCCLQDKAASDSMDPACDAAQLNSLMRMAVSRIKGVRLEHSHTSFKIVILSGILWFKVSSLLHLHG